MTEQNSSITTTVAGFTDTGMVRTNNEDNFLIADLATGRVFLIPQRISHKFEENRLLLAVSDGVGGASSGEVASSMAVHSMRVELLRRTNNTATPFERLVQAVEKANTLIWNEGQTNPERRGMGATITAALIEKNVVYIAEVGDSRGYIIHAGRIKQITTDQSLVGVLVNRGLMTPEQAETAPGRNIILQSLGCQAEIKVAVSSLEITAGDYLLLCSDGLSGKIKAEEMMSFVETNSSIEEACKQMIELAKQRGGEDNITVVLARFEGEGLKPPEYVPRLTQHIEVLAAFDPEGESQQQKAKRKQDSGKVKADKNSEKTTDKLVNKANDDEDKFKTKRLSSEKGKGQSLYTHTLGGGRDMANLAKEARAIADLATQKVSPNKYTLTQLTEQNNEVEKHLNATIVAIRKQLDYLRHTVFWAEKDNKDSKALSEMIHRLEQYLRNLESQRVSLADINKLVSEYSE